MPTLSGPGTTFQSQSPTPNTPSSTQRRLEHPPRERTQPVTKGHRCPTPNQAKPLPSPNPSPLALGLTHRSLNSLRESDPHPPQGAPHRPPWELHIPISRPSLSRSDSGWAQRPAQIPLLSELHAPFSLEPPYCGRGPAGRGQSPAPHTASKWWRRQEARSERPPHSQEADSSQESPAHERPAPRELPVPPDRPTPTPANSQARGRSALPLASQGARGWGSFLSRSSFIHTRGVALECAEPGPAGTLGDPCCTPRSAPSSHTAAGSSELLGSLAWP